MGVGDAPPATTLHPVTRWVYFVENNPIIHTDPTGHMATECGADGEDCGGSDWLDENNGAYLAKQQDYQKCLSGNDLYCSPIDKLAQAVAKAPENSVVDRASKGDPLAILDLIIPTHLGWRAQAELSINISPTSALNIVAGEQVFYNRNADMLYGNFDLGWTYGPNMKIAGLPIPIGGALTTGPLVGWGSSSGEQVSQGTSNQVGGTIAAELAVTANVSVPNSLKADPIYGMSPTTAYLGGGVGGVYFGGGGGRSYSLHDVTVWDFRGSGHGMLQDLIANSR